MERQSVIQRGELSDWAGGLRERGKKIVFTNGCFDVLHPGHIALLREAAGMGDVLIVGINSDESVRRLKGPSRPVYPEADRAEILLAVRWVDAVTVFSEDTPLETIRRIRPDVLVKGAEYGKGEIVGEEFLDGYGGKTVRFPMRGGHASSEIIKRIESSGEDES
ncbi:MAG: adenylyltransferase/cytidyltransferase family protein [Candidatus Latescibacterota bacterium]